MVCRGFRIPWLTAGSAVERRCVDEAASLMQNFGSQIELTIVILYSTLESSVLALGTTVVLYIISLVSYYTYLTKSNNVAPKKRKFTVKSDLEW